MITKRKPKTHKKKSKKRKNVQFNLRLLSSEKEILKNLRNKKAIPMTQLIRSSLNEKYFKRKCE